MRKYGVEINFMSWSSNFG